MIVQGREEDFNFASAIVKANTSVQRIFQSQKEMSKLEWLGLCQGTGL